jgi:polyhydroxyalkanoate synthesis regulator phasin
VREAITKGVIRPLNLVMITRDRMEEVLNDAVERGRMTAEDAQSIVTDLVQRGRQQTESVMGDLESLLNRSRADVEARTTKARKGVTGAVGKATKAAREAADPALAQADRARRTAGIGPNFPVMGYDDLTAAQVQKRLDGLSAPELRKVRDYEKRNANRKSVLDAVETKLNK